MNPECRERLVGGHADHVVTRGRGSPDVLARPVVALRSNDDDSLCAALSAATAAGPWASRHVSERHVDDIHAVVDRPLDRVDRLDRRAAAETRNAYRCARGAPGRHGTDSGCASSCRTGLRTWSRSRGRRSRPPCLHMQPWPRQSSGLGSGWGISCAPLPPRCNCHRRGRSPLTFGAPGPRAGFASSVSAAFAAAYSAGSPRYPQPEVPACSRCRCR